MKTVFRKRNKNVNISFEMDSNTLFDFLFVFKNEDL